MRPHEAFVEAGAAQGVAHLVVGAAGGDAGGQGDRVERLGQPLDGGQGGVHGLAVELLEPVRPRRGRLLAQPVGDQPADRGVRTPDEPLDDLGLGERPSQLRAEGDLDTGGDPLTVDQHPVAVEYHELNRQDHHRSIGARRQKSTASRMSGHVMQCPPPRPRPSSAPTTRATWTGPSGVSRPKGRGERSGEAGRRAVHGAAPCRAGRGRGNGCLRTGPAAGRPRDDVPGVQSRSG